MELEKRPLKSQIKTIIAELQKLLQDSKNQDYIGEEVSQYEHAFQAGDLAIKAKPNDSDFITACLLHDIGHFCQKNSPSMGEWGVQDHEKIGAEYLMERNFDHKVCELVQGHVLTKRYLVTTSEVYASRLSEASLATLEYQGGKLSLQECEGFERSPLFNDHLLLRKIDEQAKVVDKTLRSWKEFTPHLEKSMVTQT